jgi:hypothetical protein
MKVTIKVKGDFAKLADDERKHAGKALTDTFREGGDKLKQRGRASIAGGGFSTRWQNAFRVKTYPEHGASTAPKIFAYHKISYAGQFEDPQPILGSPYLWLPIEKNLPLQARGKRWTPHDFANNIGPLRSGRKGGRPLLFGQVTVGLTGVPLALPTSERSRHGDRVRARWQNANKRKAWLPVFVGVSAVNDPKKFDLKAQAELTAGELSGLFSEKWNANGQG